MDQSMTKWDARNKSYFLRIIWPNLTVDSYTASRDEYDIFFKIVDSLQTPLRSIEDWQKYLLLLKADQALTKQQLVAHRVFNGHDTEVVSRNFDYVATVWLTCRLKLKDHEQHQYKHLEWTEEQTLQSVVQAQFTPSPIDQAAYERNTIHPSFSMHLLCKYYNFKIKWTPYLEEHLFVDWSRQQRFQSDSNRVIEETLDTINLLFPSSEHESHGFLCVPPRASETERFLGKQRRRFHRRGQFGRDRKLLLSDYKYWHERVRVLKQYSDKRAHGFRQLLPPKGRRDYNELGILYIAIFTAVIAATTFVIGLVALVFAGLGYETEEQELDALTAIACTGTNTTGRHLRGHCSNF
ncbi:hypothetical protein GGR57DRAFT_507901 [Xylariaceae sp. FL1272]|nr:hypothetical protein GGR57DRAFT_507901 [Xylariaceae sp. FL1272]